MAATQELQCEIASHKNTVCNLSFKSASRPEDWQVANVTPISQATSDGRQVHYAPQPVDFLATTGGPV